MKESDILTGDPSREPLERLRYLKHEINAFSQIQIQQIDVLKSLESTWFLDNNYDEIDREFREAGNPHPGLSMIRNNTHKLTLQNQTIQNLNSLIDTLQSEVSRVPTDDHTNIMSYSSYRPRRRSLASKIGAIMLQWCSQS